MAGISLMEAGRLASKLGINHVPQNLEQAVGKLWAFNCTEIPEGVTDKQIHSSFPAPAALMFNGSVVKMSARPGW